MSCLVLALHRIDTDDDRRTMSILETLWRTIVLEHEYLLRDQNLSLADFMNVMKFLRRATATSPPGSSFHTELVALYAQPRACSEFAPHEVRFLCAMDDQIKGKVFFLTSNGMFGLTYPGVEAGDTLCVFDGALLPHLFNVNSRIYLWPEFPVKSTCLESSRSILDTFPTRKAR
jgi:hypothetical protein